jgi:DNA primase
MARIKDSSVEAVKEAADLVALVEARTRLRKVGGRYTGLCPFHEERTPSFSVSPDRGQYHCFGCGVGGDAISFVRETEGLDFVEAIEWLAERFRVRLEYEDVSPDADRARARRKRLYDLLEQATAFYERVLWDSRAGEPARAYLESRSFREEICREFRLGLSPVGATLVTKAREKGFGQADLQGAGLVSRRGADYFQGRLMFPLADRNGRVIAFQARKLRDDDPLRGKYVNSPESELFHKSHVLYGLNLARRAITKEERAIVVEGNADVIALRQAGLEPVVASMGTALTEVQLRELGRLTRRVFLCFDADAAGEEATLRGMELAAGQGLEVKVVPLPPGRDPADAVDEFGSLLERAESYLVYRVRLELERAGERQEAFMRVRDILSRFEDSPERQDALRLAADRLDLPHELQSGLAPRRGRGAAEVVSSKVLDAGDRLERDALAACVAHAGLRPLLRDLAPEHFDSERHRTVYAYLVNGAETMPELVPVLAELDARAAAEELSERAGKELLLRLKERRLRRQLTSASEDLARTKELQQELANVRAALDEVA